MDLLIILTYTAICTVIFKVFKIPMNKWTVPTAALGGVAILTTILMLMNYNHPYAKYGKDIFVTVPIVPQITGTVKTVDVTANEFVKQGEILFTLIDDQQVFDLEKAEAALVAAKDKVLQKNESLVAAIATAAAAQADMERSRTTYQRYQEGFDKGGENSPFSLQELDTRKKLYETSLAKFDSAKAEERRLRLITESTVLGEDTEVAQLRAARDAAQVQLDRTIIRAPSDGIATQVAIRPGTRASRLPLRPVMIFIPKEKRQFAGMFWQNSLLRLKVGLDAEVILDAVPGHVFKGKVVKIVPAMSEGEFSTSGALATGKRLTDPGFAIAIIELDENLDDYNLPLGVQGQAVAINYEHDILHVSLVRRILLRMMAWLKYVYPIK